MTPVAPEKHISNIKNLFSRQGAKNHKLHFLFTVHGTRIAAHGNDHTH